MNREETGQDFGQNAGIQKKLDSTLFKCMNTEDNGQDFGQNAGIQKKLDRISTENEV